MFAEKGLIIITDEDEELDEDKLMEDAMESGAEDFSGEDGVYEIYTVPDDVYAIEEALKAAGYEIASAEKTKVPQNTVELTNEDDIRFMSLLIEKLEEDDDVMEVYHNCDNEL